MGESGAPQPEDAAQSPGVELVTADFGEDSGRTRGDSGRTPG